MEEKIGHYRIVSELGRGGMGVVYKAHEESLNRYVALKVLGRHLTQDEEYLKRFLQEARSAAHLNHPNIVQIYFVGEDEGRHFFAMEYIPGTNVEELIKTEGKLDPARAAQIVLQAAGGLAAAHDQGIIHRDIKPANLMVGEDGTVKIADFGIAFVSDRATRLTGQGMLVGTPRYMSPEQCLGETLDGRSDLYSLGITFYEMLTGTVPFRAESPLLLMREIIEVDPIPAEEVIGSIDPRVSSVLQRLLEKRPQDRYADGHKLAADLQGFLMSQVMPGWERWGGGTGPARPAVQTVPVDEPEIPAEPTVAIETGQEAAPEGAEEAPIPEPPAPSTAVEKPPPSTTGRSRWPLALLLVLLLLGGSAAAMWKVFQRSEAETSSATVSSGAGEPVTAGQEVAGAEGGDEGAGESGATLGDSSGASESPPGPPESPPDTEPQPEPLVAQVEPIDGDVPLPQALPTARPQAEPTPQPRSSTPPPPPAATQGIMVVVVGDRMLASEVERYLEDRLAARGLPLIDERKYGDLWSMAESDRIWAAVEVARSVGLRASRLVLGQVEYLGEKRLQYRGRVESASQSRVTVHALDLATGADLMAPWSVTVEHTQVMAERAVQTALQRQVVELGRRLEF